MQHSTYWLSRSPGTQPEGPYFFDQLENMFAAGHVTAQAQICPHNGKEWRLLGAVIRNSSSKPVEATARNCEVALYALIFLAGLVSIVPILGVVFGFVAYGVITLVGTALAVVMMVKGKTARGIFGLSVVWLGMPILIFLAQFFGVGIGIGMSKYEQRKANETVLAESAARQQFEGSCREEAKAVMVRSGWSTEGVKFSVPISSKDKEPVVYAELPANQGADIWRFDFRTDGTVDKIISTKRGELYRQAEPADPTEAMRRRLDGTSPYEGPPYLINSPTRKLAWDFINARHTPNLLSVIDKEEHGKTRLYIRFLDRNNRDLEWRFEFTPDNQLKEVYSPTEGDIK